MKRVPVGATIVVTLAIAAMIALGIWQLQRLGQKESALARLAQNIVLPPVPFPTVGSGDALLFRHSAVTCLRPINWTREAGRDASGATGWRQIATCATSAGGAVPVQLGVARSPDARPAWTGGTVRGWISHAPDHRPLLAGLVDHSPKRLMLVADGGVAGLAPNPPPDLSAVPNNHLAYAVQWFFFAGVALVIYVLALRRRV
jgi:surfeit locus 1 family protein